MFQVCHLSMNIKNPIQILLIDSSPHVLNTSLWAAGSSWCSPHLAATPAAVYTLKHTHTHTLNIAVLMYSYVYPCSIVSHTLSYSVASPFPITRVNCPGMSPSEMGVDVVSPSQGGGLWLWKPSTAASLSSTGFAALSVGVAPGSTSLWETVGGV